MALDFKGLLDKVREKINPKVAYTDHRTGTPMTGRLSDVVFNPDRYFSGVGEVVGPNITRGLTPLFGQENAGNIGQFFQGAANTTGVLNPSLYGSGAQATANRYLPTTPQQQFSKDLGGFTAGAVMTAPLTPGGTIAKLFSIGRNALIGGVFGVGSATVGAGMQGRLPTQQELGQGAYEGVKNSWVYPATSFATNTLLQGASRIAPQIAKPAINALTDQGMKTSGAITQQLARQGAPLADLLKQGGQRVLTGALRETAETPLETAYFAGQDTGEGSYLDKYLNRLPQDAIANFALGGARSALGTGYNTVKGKAEGANVSVPTYLAQQKAPGFIDLNAPITAFANKKGSVRWDNIAPLEETPSYVRPAGKTTPAFVVNTSGDVSKVKQMSRQETKDFMSQQEAKPADILPPGGALPAPEPQLSLPASRPSATITQITQLKKLAKTGADLSGVTFVAKTRADRAEALKYISGNQISAYAKTPVDSGKVAYVSPEGEATVAKENLSPTEIDINNNKAEFGTEPRDSAGAVRSTIDRTVLPILNRVRATGKAGREISRLYEDTNMEAQQIYGKYNNALDEAGRPLSKEQRADFADYVEGKKPIDSPEVQKAVDAWRVIAKEIYDRAKEAGLDTGFIENYFPHKGEFTKPDEIIAKLVAKGVDPETASKRVSGFLARSGERRYGSLDYSREFPELDYKKDFRELYGYVQDATVRATQASRFGAKDEVLYNLASQTKDPTSVNKYLDQLLQKNKYSGKQPGEDVSRVIRGVQTILKLNPLTSALNLTQNLNTIARTDHATFAKALIRVISNPSDAWKRAQEVGEIQPDMVKLFGEDYNNSSATGKWIKWIGMAGTERFNRVMAVASGEIYAEKLMKQANAGSGAAMRELKRFGIDWKNDTSTDAAKKMVNQAAIKTSRQTQFSAPESELPANWQTPAGKVITQFKSFAYQQTKAIGRETKRAFEEVKNGNFKPLANDLLVVGVTAPIVGEILADVKALIKNKERDDMTLAERYVDNIKEAVSLGLIDNLSGLFGEYGAKGIVGTIGGPTAGDVVSGATALSEANAGLQDYDPEKTFADNLDPNSTTRRWLVGNIPGIGKTASNTLIDNAGVDNMWGGVNEGLSKPDKEIYRSLEKTNPAYAETFKKENKFSFDKDKLSLTDVLAGKTTAVDTSTIPPVDAPPAVHKKYKTALTEKLDLGQELTPEETAYYYLENKTLKDQKEYKDINKFYSKLYSLSNDDKISDEAKKVIIEKSGVDPKDWEYYRLASATDEEKLDNILRTVTNAKDTDSAMIALLQGKRTVGNKSMFTSSHADYLYDRGIITKEQKALLNAVKYDELFKQFYVDRDFEGSIGGSSGSGGDGGLTKAKVISLMKQVYSAYGDPLKPKSNKIKGTTISKVTSTKAPTPIQTVLTKKKKDSSKLWFKAY